MKFFFLCVGVPTEIYTAVRKERNFIGGLNTEVELLGGNGPFGTPYTAKTAKDAMAALQAKTAAEDKSDTPRAFGVLYVSGGNNAVLLNELFPSIYSVPVEWALSGYDRLLLSQSKNELVGLFREKAVVARAALEVVARELKEQAQRTPWLLPVKNFRSGRLVGDLESLQTELLGAVDRHALLKDRNNAFRQTHPPQRVTEGHHADRSYFVDNAGIAFKPPGRDMHGFHQPVEGSGHTARCHVSSRRRLGAPYDRAFHYDCTKGDGATSAWLCSCHNAVAVQINSPKHINASTNDFTRP
jgi:hypothetical protein